MLPNLSSLVAAEVVMTNCDCHQWQQSDEFLVFSFFNDGFLQNFDISSALAQGVTTDLY